MGAFLKCISSTKKRDNYLFPISANKIEEVQYRIHSGSEEKNFWSWS